MSKKKKRRKEVFVTLFPLRLKSMASTVWTVRCAMVRSMHETMVTDVLRAFEVIVTLVGTVLTME
jgi:hypothetical protein